MIKFIISCAVALLALAALVLTIKIRKKVEFPVFLFLITFEIIVILAAGWVGIIYGAMMEMGNI